MSIIATQWLFFHENQLIMLNDYTLPSTHQLAHLQDNIVRQYALDTYYCAEIAPHIKISTPLVCIPLKASFNYLGPEWFKPVTKAFQILQWDKNHTYCGRCGQKTHITPDILERYCADCSLVFYPRISPAVIVLIKKENQILMARSPHFPPGVYGLIAGFIEAGESVEDALCREVKEEVNIEIKNIQYFGSQPWPFPDSLMLAFTADYASGDVQIDHKEIEEANWYDIDHLPGRPSLSFSIAHELIDAQLS